MGDQKGGGGGGGGGEEYLLSIKTLAKELMPYIITSPIHPQFSHQQSIFFPPHTLLYLYTFPIPLKEVGLLFMLCPLLPIASPPHPHPLHIHIYIHIHIHIHIHATPRE